MLDDFRFGFKVTAKIRIKNYPNHPRHGAKAGQPNTDFLNADRVATAILKPCEDLRAKVGGGCSDSSSHIFWPSDYEHGREFVSDLAAFLGKLPKGWP